ncbi:MAG: hypothetical protein ABH884_04205 [Candidatus Komeilibacteria bacterium]
MGNLEKTTMSSMKTLHHEPRIYKAKVIIPNKTVEEFITELKELLGKADSDDSKIGLFGLRRKESDKEFTPGVEIELELYEDEASKFKELAARVQAEQEMSVGYIISLQVTDWLDMKM